MSCFPHSVWLVLALGCAFGPLLTFFPNLRLYRAPRTYANQALPLPRVSVLIPARNEEHAIEAAIESILASVGVELELLVLDDASLDRTGAVVQSIADRDARLSLHAAPSLPSGWNGKQHACAELAKLAKHEALCFLDADVRLAPDALARLLATMEQGTSALLSGFPHEETGTWLEKLLIPLIHFVLLCYLPMAAMRRLPHVPSLAAGCGQLMIVRRAAYIASGGHAAIRETMHDGILLPQLFRRHGFATALYDLTDLASCRMYRNAREVWCGLGKNATEGMAAPSRILPFTFMLAFGQVVPAVWFVCALYAHDALFWPLLALAAGYLPRAIALLRFRQSLFGALLHPVGVAVLLALQWWALGNKLLGRQATWKERAYDLV